MTLFDWIVVAFCWSLPFAVWAIRRWRVRVYLTAQHPSLFKPRPWPEPPPAITCEDFTEPPPNERWPVMPVPVFEDEPGPAQKPAR